MSDFSIDFSQLYASVEKAIKDLKALGDTGDAISDKLSKALRIKDAGKFEQEVKQVLKSMEETTKVLDTSKTSSKHLESTIKHLTAALDPLNRELLNKAESLRAAKNETVAAIRFDLQNVNTLARLTRANESYGTEIGKQIILKQAQNASTKAALLDEYKQVNVLENLIATQKQYDGSILQGINQQRSKLKLTQLAADQESRLATTKALVTQAISDASSPEGKELDRLKAKLNLLHSLNTEQDRQAATFNRRISSVDSGLLNLAQVNQAKAESNNLLPLATARLNLSSNTASAKLQAKADSPQLTQASATTTAQNEAKLRVLEAENKLLLEQARAVNAVTAAQADAIVKAEELKRLNKQALEQELKLARERAGIGNTVIADEGKKKLDDLSGRLKFLQSPQGVEAAGIQKNIDEQTRLNKLYSRSIPELLGLTNAQEAHSRVLSTSYQTAAAFRGGINAMQSSLGAYTSGAMAAAGATYAVVSQMRLAFETGLKYTETMSRARAMINEFNTGLTREEMSKVTDETFKSVESRVKDLGSTTVYGATAVANGLVKLAQAGLSSSEALSALKPTLDLAKIGEMDVAAATDIATNTLMMFGKTSEELVNVVDILAVAAARSNTNVQQLGNAMTYAGPAANAAGVSIQETAAAMATLANNGFNSSRAGTALRSFFISLKDPTKEGAEILNKYGISAKNAEGNLRSLTDILSDMNKNIPEADRLTAIERIVGKYASSGIVSLVKSSTQFSGHLRNFGNAKISGMAEEMSRNLENNLSGDISKVTSKIENLRTIVFDKYEVMNRGLVVSVANYLDELNRPSQTILDKIDELTKEADSRVARINSKVLEVSKFSESPMQKDSILKMKQEIADIQAATEEAKNKLLQDNSTQIDDLISKAQSYIIGIGSLILAVSSQSLLGGAGKVFRGMSSDIRLFTESLGIAFNKMSNSGGMINNLKTAISTPFTTFSSELAATDKKLALLGTTTAKATGFAVQGLVGLVGTAISGIGTMVALAATAYGMYQLIASQGNAEELANKAKERQKDLEDSLKKQLEYQKRIELQSLQNSITQNTSQLGSLKGRREELQAILDSASSSSLNTKTIESYRSEIVLLNDDITKLERTIRTNQEAASHLSTGSMLEVNTLSNQIRETEKALAAMRLEASSVAYEVQDGVIVQQQSTSEILKTDAAYQSMLKTLDELNSKLNASTLSMQKQVDALTLSRKIASETKAALAEAASKDGGSLESYLNGGAGVGEKYQVVIEELRQNGLAIDKAIKESLNIDELSTTRAQLTVRLADIEKQKRAEDLRRKEEQNRVILEGSKPDEKVKILRARLAETQALADSNLINGAKPTLLDGVKFDKYNAANAKALEITQQLNAATASLEKSSEKSGRKQESEFNKALAFYRDLLSRNDKVRKSYDDLSRAEKELSILLNKPGGISSTEKESAINLLKIETQRALNQQLDDNIKLRREANQSLDAAYDIGDKYNGITSENVAMFTVLNREIQVTSSNISGLADDYYKLMLAGEKLSDSEAKRKYLMFSAYSEGFKMLDKGQAPDYMGQTSQALSNYATMDRGQLGVSLIGKVGDVGKPIIEARIKYDVSRKELEAEHTKMVMAYAKDRDDKLRALEEMRANKSLASEQVYLDKKRQLNEEYANKVFAQDATSQEKLRGLEDSRLQAVSESKQLILASIAGATSEMLGMFASADKESSDRQKAAFVLQKALAISQIMISTHVAAAQARVTDPTGALATLVMAQGYASAGLVAGMAVAQFNQSSDKKSSSSSTTSKYAGAYDKGGYVPSNSWAIVGEYGPEIVTGPANVTSRKKTEDILSGKQTNLSVAPVINVTYNSGSGGGTAEDAKLLAAAVKTQVQQVISNELRANGMISQAIRGRNG